MKTATPEEWYEKKWLVILLYFFFFPVGLYALWKSSKFNKGWKIGLTAFVALGFIAALSDDSQASSDRNTSQQTKPAEAPPAKKEARLFETPDDFKDAFNKYSTSNSLGMEIDELTIVEGEVNNTFKYTLNQNVSVVGSISKKDGSVKEVMMFGSGDGSISSGGNIILCMLGIIAAVDPGIAPENRIDILKETGLIGKKDIDLTDFSGKTQRNGIKYFVTSTELTGLMFGASTQ